MTAATSQQFARHFGLPDIGALSALETATIHFSVAAEGDDPLLRCSLGLRSFLLAVGRGEHRTPDYHADRLNDVAVRAALTLVRSSDALPLNRAIAGFGAFRELVDILANAEPPAAELGGVLLDRFDQVALYGDELDALHRRAAINARGAPLARHHAIQDALLATPAGAHPH